MRRGALAGAGLAVFVGLWAGLAAMRPADAQIMLPGAMNGSSAGRAPKASGNAGSREATHAPPKPIVIKPPGEDGIVGHVLARNGSDGAMTFVRQGADLALSKLSLVGDKISAPAKSCKLDVALDAPIVAAAGGRPAGALRFDVPLKACPFAIDILDGAVLVSPATPTCAFAAADCKVVLAGLWGPPATDISDKRARELLRERVRIETTMRADFRVLLKRAGKDRAAVKAIAGEQAGFSSAREMACRDYARETAHGFCSTQMTEARVLALLAKFGDEPEPRDARKHATPTKSRPMPATSAATPAEEPADR